MLAAGNVTGRKTGMGVSAHRLLTPQWSDVRHWLAPRRDVRRKDDLGEDLTAECAKALGREHLAATSLTGVGEGRRPLREF